MNKVLIVDDAAFMRMTVKNMLEKNGYSIVGESTNGLDAIRMYKELRPDLVTMDITMPSMNGIESLKEIIRYDPEAKVIMLSAMGQEVMVRDAVFAGAKAFLVKPFTESNLIKALYQIIQK